MRHCAGDAPASRSATRRCATRSPRSRHSRSTASSTRSSTSWRWRRRSPAAARRQFEQLVREGLQQSLLPQPRSAQSAFATPSRGRPPDRAARRDAATSSVAILPAPAPDTAPVTDAEIQAWYDAHTARLPRAGDGDARIRRHRRRRRCRAARRRRGGAAPALRAGEGAVHRPRAAPGLAHPDRSSDEARAPAVQKAAREQGRPASPRRHAQPGADFAALARANSDDAGSKDSRRRPRLDRARARWPGVRERRCSRCSRARSATRCSTDFGWHVIQLREVQAGKQTSFEQARAQLETEHARDRPRARVQRPHRQAGRPGLQEPDLAGPRRAQVGPAGADRWVRSRAARAPASPANPPVQRAAFSESPIAGRHGQRSDRDRARTTACCIRVTEHSPERAAAAGRSRATGSSRRSAPTAQRKAAQKRADALVAQVQGGQTLAAAASAQRPRCRSDRPACRAARTRCWRRGVTEAFFATPAAAGKVRCRCGEGAAGRPLRRVRGRRAVQPGRPQADIGGDRARVAASSSRSCTASSRPRRLLVRRCAAYDDTVDEDRTSELVGGRNDSWHCRALVGRRPRDSGSTIRRAGRKRTGPDMPGRVRMLSSRAVGVARCRSCPRML